MRALATVLLLVLIATPALAGVVEIKDISQRTDAKFSNVVTLTPQVSGVQNVDSNAQPMHVGIPASKVAVELNCEDDGVVNLSNTLLISAGDLVGNIFAAPGSPSPFHIREVVFGLVDFGQVYPANLLMEFYEDDLAGSFQFVTSVVFNIASSPGGGTIYTADISAFNIVMTNDVLTLYGDDVPSEAGYMIPTADDSPRCYNGTNVCSVHVPSANPSLFLYGFGDAGCPAPGIILSDLNHRLIVDELPVSTFRSSFGKVKSEYDE